ncbi:MAG: hypothetical protein ACI843_002855 [Psychrobacter glaciei]|jgi:hypothetical protein
MRNFICLLLFTLAFNVSGQQAEIELGDTGESVLEKFGEPTETKEVQMKDKVFITYYYQNTNSSYVIDKKLNIVCETALGKTEGFCYPCDYGPEAGMCP